MRILKILIGIIAALVIIVGVLSLAAPTKMEVSREAVIKAPKALVYNNISHFSKMNAWSPWVKRDPNIQLTLDGTDGTVGATSAWKGNDEVGEGSQSISKLDADRIETTINFVKPFESTANAFFDIKEAEEGTSVKWGFTSTMPRPFNIMGLFMDMDAAIGKDYEEGLGYLKQMCESEAVAALQAQKELMDAAMDSLEESH